MNNQKLGILLIAISLILLTTFSYYNTSLTRQSRELGCFSLENCTGIENVLSLSHVLIGIFSFLLALGFYLLFFDKTEKAILERLEREKETRIEGMKFDILLKALDPFEQSVVKLIKGQEGITQNTLRLRADMSKAKLSYVLQELERRGIIKRVQKGKTLSIHLKI